LDFELLIGSTGTIAAVIALLLYLRDRLRVESVLVQTYVRIMKPDKYLIQSNISNEGGKKADGYDVVVEIDGNVVTHLAYAPVDSPLGRIGVD